MARGGAWKAMQVQRGLVVMLGGTGYLTSSSPVPPGSLRTPCVSVHAGLS